jgi:chorismate dehydratase
MTEVRRAFYPYLTMTPIRIGCVKYLNTLPMIEGLQAWKEAELVAAVPSRLIDMLLSREVAVSLSSVIDGARHGDRVRLLPVGMIGCDGPTLTVRLFSRVPIEQIKSVGVDTDSHTSAVLLQVILARRYGVQPRVLDFDAREHMVLEGTERRSDGATKGEVDAVLLIGDKVVTDPPAHGEYPHELDLGEAWKAMTGLPFVYAAWMCRAGEEHSPEVQAAAAVLDRQLRHNRTRLGWVVQSRAAERHWPEDTAAKYVGSYLKYTIDEPEREAVAKFIAWAHELGLCEGDSVHWAELGGRQPLPSVLTPA